MSLRAPCLRLVTLVLLLAELACSSKPKSAALPPLLAPSWSVQLDVAGFGAASVALPLAATAPRPLVVVLHGARDRAEWQCGSFRGMLGGQVFILCPRGRAAEGDLFGLGSIEDSETELRAALSALKARFGRHLAAGPIVLVGYAEGADVAADLARQEPSFFGRVALVKGNPGALSASAIKVFAERGGKRVLFFCTDENCHNGAVERSLLLTRASVTARAVEHAVGPFLDQRFADALRGELRWLMEGDERFAVRRR